MTPWKVREADQSTQPGPRALPIEIHNTHIMMVWVLVPCILGPSNEVQLLLFDLSPCVHNRLYCSSSLYFWSDSLKPADLLGHPVASTSDEKASPMLRPSHFPSRQPVPCLKCFVSDLLSKTEPQSSHDWANYFDHFKKLRTERSDATNGALFIVRTRWNLHFQAPVFLRPHRPHRNSPVFLRLWILS